MSTEKSFCSHCHLVVAPGDPGKVTLGRSAAHNTCIMRARGEELRDSVVTFLRRHADDLVTQEFIQRLGRPSNYELFKRFAERALQRTYVNGNGADATRKRAVERFARQLGGALLTEITFVPHSIQKAVQDATQTRAN